ncbi:MAG: biotin--[acetyl-CoA-carboxylase] ligase [Sulfolobales archaeon]
MEFKIFRIKECTSTQDIAKELAESGSVEGTVVVADRMTSGRGRLNRLWVADEGGLWFTIILRPNFITNIQLITLIAGLSVVRGIKKMYDVPLELKWPNDVLLQGKKICGILTEASVTNNSINHLLLGVGINVNNELYRDLKFVATSLKNYLGFEVPINELLTTILKEFEELYRELQSGNVGKIINEWKKYNTTIGKYVKVYVDSGVVEGIAVDIDFDGSLVVKVDGNITKIYSGDVIHLRIDD